MKVGANLPSSPSAMVDKLVFALFSNKRLCYHKRGEHKVRPYINPRQRL
jgi:hypothetical protein